MTKRYVRKAKDYKLNFEFLSDGTNISNAAYHMQFIEHCFREKQELEKTTKSLMNRVIIIELGSIVELCLSEILSNLKVNILFAKDKQLNIPEYFTLGKILPMAVYYGLVDEQLNKKLEKLNERRNSIHFKKFRTKRILEYDYYTDEMTNESIDIFIDFMDSIQIKIKGVKKSFVWPWED